MTKPIDLFTRLLVASMLDLRITLALLNNSKESGKPPVSLGPVYTMFQEVFYPIYASNLLVDLEL